MIVQGAHTRPRLYNLPFRISGGPAHPVPFSSCQRRTRKTFAQGKDDFVILKKETDYDGDEVTTYGPSDDEDAAAAPSASPNSAAARKARMESESEESTATKTGSQPSSPDVRETAVIAEEAAEVVAKVEGAVESDSEVQLPLVESEVPIAESAISQKAPDTEGETSVEPREALEQLTVVALRGRCKEAGLSGYSKLKKLELVDLLLSSIK